MTPAGPGDPSPRALAVFDVDGVLADVGHRLHHLEGPRKDWGGFFSAADQDPPLQVGLDLALQLASDHDLAFLTGRPEHLRGVTQAWLTRHGVPAGPLWMRPGRDRRPARVMKLDALTRLASQRPVAVVVDDDAEVVEALRGAGFPVLHADWAEHVRDRRSAWHQETLRAAQEEDGRT